MAVFLRWREEWCVGIDIIDEGHRQLAAAIDDMALRFGADSGGVAFSAADSASVDAPAPKSLVRALARFADLAGAHFAQEEALMRAIDDGGLVHHSCEHRLLRAELAELIREVDAEAASQLSLAALERLKHWLLSHVLDADRDLAASYFALCGYQPEWHPPPQRKAVEPTPFLLGSVPRHWLQGPHEPVRRAARAGQDRQAISQPAMDDHETPATSWPPRWLQALDCAGCDEAPREWQEGKA